MATIVSTKFLLPGFVVSNGQITGNPWSQPQNILLVDNLVTESNPGSGVASDIIIGGFNPNLPQNAIVTGIVMELLAYRGALNNPAQTITLNAIDNTSGQDLFYPYITPQSLTDTLETYTLGSQTYLFDTTLTPDQVNNLKFQLVANGDVYADSFLMQVFYYIPDTPTPPTPSAGGCDTCDSPIQVTAMELQLPFLIGEDTFYLKKGSFQYADGTPIQPTDLGACGGKIYFVFDQGQVRGENNSNFMENATLDTTLGFWTILPSGVVQVSLGTINQRALQFHTPYAHVDDLMSDHDANTTVIISNNGPYEGQKIRACQVDTVFSAPIVVESNDAPLTTPAHDLDFRGSVNVTNDPLNPFRKLIQITNGGGTTPPVVISTIGDSSGSTQVHTFTTSKTISIQGINRFLRVPIDIQGGRTIASVVLNTPSPTSLTSIVTHEVGGVREEQWGIVAPQVGEYTITITLTGSETSYISMGAECIVGVNQSSPTGATATNDGVSAAGTVSITTTVDNSLIFDDIGTGAAPLVFTKGPSQVQDFQNSVVTDLIQDAGSYQMSGTEPDAVVMSWIISKSTQWVMTAVEIKGLTVTAGTGVQSVTGFYVDNTDPLNPIITVPKNNMTAVVAPTVSNDSSEGYSIGSEWFDTITSTLYIAQSVGVGTAVWDAVGGASGATLTVQKNGSTVATAVDLINITGAANVTSPSANQILIDILAGGSGGGNKLYLNTTPATSSSGTVVAWTYALPGGILKTNNAIRISIFGIATGAAGEILVSYGGHSYPVSTYGDGTLGTRGTYEAYIMANTATNAQIYQANMTQGPINGGDSAAGYVTGNSTVDSTTNQNIVVTITPTTAFNSISVGSILIEEITDGSGSENISNPLPAGSNFEGSTTPVAVVIGDGSSVLNPYISTTVSVSQTLGQDPGSGFGFGKSAQPFRLTGAKDLFCTGVILDIQVIGTRSDQIKVSIQTDSAGLPDGISLASQTVTLASGAGFKTFSWSGINLTQGIDYWIVVEITSTVYDVSNYYSISGEGSSGINPFDASESFPISGGTPTGPGTWQDFGNPLGLPGFMFCILVLKYQAGYVYGALLSGTVIYDHSYYSSGVPQSDIVTGVITNACDGVVNESVSAGSSVDLISDGVATGFSLTNGTNYFVGTQSTLVTSGSIKVGRAVNSGNSLFIRRY